MGDLFGHDEEAIGFPGLRFGAFEVRDIANADGDPIDGLGGGIAQRNVGGLENSGSRLILAADRFAGRGRTVQCGPHAFGRLGREHRRDGAAKSVPVAASGPGRGRIPGREFETPCRRDADDDVLVARGVEQGAHHHLLFSRGSFDGGPTATPANGTETDERE
nr:hypothetical protein [Methylobacterium sp.]